MSGESTRNPNLTDEQRQVLFEADTEIPGTGKYLNHNADGTYACVNCGNRLFASDTKYDSTTPGLIGWPSFSEAIDQGAIRLKDDHKLPMKRVEVVCAKCGGHLGHVFPDETSPNGKHYCINSCVLDFKPKS